MVIITGLSCWALADVIPQPGRKGKNIRIGILYSEAKAHTGTSPALRNFTAFHRLTSSGGQSRRTRASLSFPRRSSPWIGVLFLLSRWRFELGSLARELSIYPAARPVGLSLTTPSHRYPVRGCLPCWRVNNSVGWNTW